MKNLILIILFIFSVNKLNAQDTFVKKYTSFVTKDDKGISDWKTVSLTVVYNEKVTNDVVMYYPNKTKRLYKIGNIEEGETNNGEEYQLIKCIDDEGVEIRLQLFDDSLRLFIGEYYIEFPPLPREQCH